MTMTMAMMMTMTMMMMMMLMMMIIIIWPFRLNWAGDPCGIPMRSDSCPWVATHGHDADCAVALS
eukprot:144040-Karenia_brevis.AAC.1